MENVRLDKVQRDRERKIKLYDFFVKAGLVATVVGLATMGYAHHVDPDIANAGVTCGDTIASAGAITAGAGIAGSFFAWVKKETLKEEIAQEESLER